MPLVLQQERLEVLAEAAQVAVVEVLVAEVHQEIAKVLGDVSHENSKRYV
jgi:division protein CdvB (Snf7/Vps24/ESCRT-III family)